LLAVGIALNDATVALVSGLSGTELADALRAAVAEQILIVDSDGQFRLRHALLREAVYEDLLPGERGSFHLACERALELWPRVGDAVQVTGGDHVDLLEQASLANGLLGELRRSELLAEQALAEIDPEAEPAHYAMVLNHRARVRWRLNRPTAALADAARALELLPGEPSSGRAQLQSWLARTELLRGHFLVAVTEGERALEMAQALELTDTVGETLNTLGMARIAAGEVEEGESMMRQAIALAREADRMEEMAFAYSNLADLLNLHCPS
jgi:tetratricopeptide (TPR) repeat protein